MNIRAYVKARRLALPPMEKVTLLAICARMSKASAVARASRHTLALDTGAATSSIQLALGELRKKQLVVVSGRPGQTPVWLPGPEFPPFTDGDESVDNSGDNLTDCRSGDEPIPEDNLTDSRSGQPDRFGEPTRPIVGQDLTDGRSPKGYRGKSRGSDAPENGEAEPAPAAPDGAPAPPVQRQLAPDPERVLLPGWGRLHPDTIEQLKAGGRFDALVQNGGEDKAVACPDPAPAATTAKRSARRTARAKESTR